MVSRSSTTGQWLVTRAKVQVSEQLQQQLEFSQTGGHHKCFWDIIHCTSFGQYCPDRVRNVVRGQRSTAWFLCTRLA